MSAEVKQLLEFESFQLDPDNRVLMQNGIPVPLTPKGFDLLLLLIQSDKLLHKEELIKALWPNTFVDESNLTQTVFMLRKALGESAGHPRFIITVPGHGYRFGGDLKKLSLERPTDPRARFVPSAGNSERLGPLQLRHVVLLLAGVLVIVAATAFGSIRWLSHRHVSSSAAQRVTIAVLPFENITGDVAQDYLADGFTEEMITHLGRLSSPQFGVIARTSVMRYKNSRPALPEVAQDLGVQFILEGSIRRDAGRVRITAQLIQLSDQSHLWAGEYDREFKDLLGLQSEIAAAIAGQITVALGDVGPRDRQLARVQAAANDEAYEAYLKGRFCWNMRNSHGFNQALYFFQQAIEKDPNYAPAYAGLADTYAMMSSYSLVPANEYMPKAQVAAAKALEIDDNLAEAHVSAAVIAENYEWNWRKAEEQYRRAIELNPSYAPAHQWYAELLGFQGRFDEALAESERARTLDPLSAIIAADNGALLYFSRRYDLAIDRFRSVLDMDPNFARAHLILGAYVETGRFQDAVSELRQWHKFDDGPWVSAWEVYVYGRAGERLKALASLNKLKQSTQTAELDPSSMFALAYCGLKDKEHALAWLETAARNHSNVPTALAVDPAYDVLRDDARFQKLLSEVKLPRTVQLSQGFAFHSRR